MAKCDFKQKLILYQPFKKALHDRFWYRLQELLYRSSACYGVGSFTSRVGWHRERKPQACCTNCPFLLDCIPQKQQPKAQSCTLEEVIFSVHVWIVSDDVERGPPRHHLEHQHPQCPPVHTEPCKAHTAHSFHPPSHTNQHWWPALRAGITDLHHHWMSLSLLNWDDKWRRTEVFAGSKAAVQMLPYNII